jgi:DNA-binding IclR family transcriptional regulator
VSAVEIGSAYSRQEPLARLARPVLARLVEVVGHSAHLAVLHGREVLRRHRAHRRLRRDG